MKNTSQSNNLTSEQQADFNRTCQLMGVKEKDIPKSITVEKGQTEYLAADSQYASLIQHKSFEIQNLEDLQKIVGSNLEGKSQVTGPFHVPPPLDVHPPLDDLNGDQIDHLDMALKLFLSGHAEHVSSYRDQVESYFFPMTALGFTALNKTVKSGSKLVIKGNGHNPVLVNYGNLTIEEGGQVVCETNVTMTVQNFTKTKASS